MGKASAEALLAAGIIIAADKHKQPDDHNDAGLGDKDDAADDQAGASGEQVPADSADEPGSEGDIASKDVSVGSLGAEENTEPDVQDNTGSGPAGGDAEADAGATRRAQLMAGFAKLNEANKTQWRRASLEN